MALIGLPASALANGDMGLAYQMFDCRYWYVYVVLTVIFEAWYMGVKSNMGWVRSLGVSFLANLVSALLPMTCCIPFLHGSFVGSGLNPNPFMNAVVLLFGFGLISTLIEGAVWEATARRFFEFSSKRIFFRMLKAQMIVGAMGLCIFLIPLRPYLGMTGMQSYWRREQVRACLKSYVANQDEQGRLPVVSSAEDLTSRFPARGEDYWKEDQWVCAYIPDYTRFSFGQSRIHAFELNPKLSGLNIQKYFDENEEIWVLRTRDEKTGECLGYVLNRDTPSWRIDTDDPKRLGYSPEANPQK